MREIAAARDQRVEHLDRLPLIAEGTCMIDLERQLIEQLITAAWPFSWQVAFALAATIGYFIWSRLYFRVIDPLLRARLGQTLGCTIIWVLRHSANYQTAFESGFARYTRWSWGIAMEHQRSFLRDGAVVLLCFLCVNILSGLWPVAVFMLVALGLRALSYIIFLPSCLVMVTIYAIFWSGRYEVSGMEQAVHTGS
jgi:cytochrome c oxidase subunit IV